MKKRKLIFLFLFFGTMLIRAGEEQNLVVQAKSGTENTYALSGVQRIIFSGGTMSVVKKDITQSDFTMSEIQKLLFASTTTAVKEENAVSLKAYPNPTTDLLFVEGVNTKENVHLYNLFGNELSVSFALVGSSLQVNTAGLPQGLYLLQINNQTIKFQKQ